MPLERIDSYFNGAVESYDERLKRSAEDEDGYIRRTAEFFPKKEHLHILDIGIGTGTGLTAILEQNPTIYVDGIDCADKMLSEIPKICRSTRSASARFVVISLNMSWSRKVMTVRFP